MRDCINKLFKNRRYRDESSNKFFSSLKMATPLIQSEPKHHRIEIQKHLMELKVIMKLAAREFLLVLGCTKRESRSSKKMTDYFASRCYDENRKSFNI